MCTKYWAVLTIVQQLFSFGMIKPYFNNCSATHHNVIEIYNEIYIQDKTYGIHRFIAYILID